MNTGSSVPASPTRYSVSHVTLSARPPEVAGSEPAGFEDVAADLADDEALVEFFAVDGRLCAFVVTADGCDTHVWLSTRERVDRLLGALRFQLAKFAHDERYTRAHRERLRRSVDTHLEALYAELLGPLEPALEEEQATEGATVDALRSSQVVHISTHGRHNVDAPVFQTLYLHPTADTDGRLHAYELLGLDLRDQFRHPCRAAGALQATVVDGHAARVITPVLQPLKALDEDGNDVALGDRADDAAHGETFRSGSMLALRS